MSKAVWLAVAGAVISSCSFSSAIEVPGVGGQGGGGAGTGGGGVVTGCDPSATDNATRDTDCDGLSDAEEYTLYHTDPCRVDSDGDGLPDGLEAGRTTTVSTSCGTRFAPDLDPTSKTNPLKADTDGDGLSDGQEDRDHNGRRDPTETDPLRKDTDCDGYSDGQELAGLAGCVTDPLLRDSDGDGLPDGVEGGLRPPGADPLLDGGVGGCVYTAATFDVDPTTHTSACLPDTDGDGIQDGAEDTNHDGRVDPGELDPTDAGDGAGPAQAACATANLKPVSFFTSGLADVQVALVPEFAEVTTLADGSGQRGFAFYDAARQVAGLVLSKTPAGADATTEEGALRLLLGTVSAPLTQAFTTWDGFPAIHGTYDVAVSPNQDLKSRLNAIATGLVPGATGTLPGLAGVTGPFKVQVSTVRRTATRAVVVVALVPANLYQGQALFTLDDVAGGTGVAQFGDFTNVQCEVFPASVGAKVDFLWVVDDSGSMSASQTAVGKAGLVFEAKLQSAGLDWRVGAVTTTYYQRGLGLVNCGTRQAPVACCSPDGTCANRFRAFTTDVPTMRKWFTLNDPTWFNIDGSGREEHFDSARNYVTSVLLPASSNPADNKFRVGAAVHLITLSDTEEQSPSTLTSFIAWLQSIDGAGTKAVLHGIICPEGVADCGDGTSIPTPGRLHAAIRSTGGVDGDIQIANQATPGSVQEQQLQNTVEAIVSAAIGGTGHQLSRPPISPTIKVAIETGGTVGACAANDVPRDRTNGWDLDSATRRLVFYGSCIPRASGIKVAVSYRYWNDGSPDPNGDACAGACQGTELVCDPGTKTCVCPPSCGGCGVGLTCNQAACACEPTIG